MELHKCKNCKYKIEADLGILLCGILDKDGKYDHLDRWIRDPKLLKELDESNSTNFLLCEELNDDGKCKFYKKEWFKFWVK